MNLYYYKNNQNHMIFVLMIIVYLKFIFVLSIKYFLMMVSLSARNITQLSMKSYTDNLVLVVDTVYYSSFVK